MSGRKHDKEEATALARVLAARLRAERGQTQAEVARGARLSRDGYARLEQGTNLPSLLVLVRVCNCLELSPGHALPQRPWPLDEEGEALERIFTLIQELDPLLIPALEQIVRALPRRGQT